MTGVLQLDLQSPPIRAADLSRRLTRKTRPPVKGPPSQSAADLPLPETSQPHQDAIQQPNSDAQVNPIQEPEFHELDLDSLGLSAEDRQALGLEVALEMEASYDDYEDIFNWGVWG